MVAGVSGGVGTTTVATTLGAADCGVFGGRPADVLVCRATGESLVRAAAITQRITSAGRTRPVVAVTSTGPGRMARPVTERIRLLEPHTAAVVIVPFVHRWREVTDPLTEVAGLLDRPPGALPRPLRRYTTALHQIRAALDRARPGDVRGSTPARAPLRQVPTPTPGRTY